MLRNALFGEAADGIGNVGRDAGLHGERPDTAELRRVLGIAVGLWMLTRMGVGTTDWELAAGIAVTVTSDASNKPRIAVAPVPDEGLGQAINDRLRRASA